MQQQDRKRLTEDFTKNFLYDTKGTFPNKLQATVSGASSSQQRGGSETRYGNTVTGRNHTRPSQQGDYYEQGASEIAYANIDEHHNQQSAQAFYHTDQHQQAGSERAYVTQRYKRQNSQDRYYTDQEHQYNFGAGGDAKLDAIKVKYNNDGKDVCSKRSQTRPDRNQNPEATYTAWSPSSSRSNSSRRTAIEQSKKKDLMRLTHSKASLLKIVDEGISGVQHEHCCCNKNMMSTGQNRQCTKQTLNLGSDDSIACSSPSAGLINEKIIHPMIKKFRLLYLHNIKEEVTIMEDLEKLPHKLDEICKKMEKE